MTHDHDPDFPDVDPETGDEAETFQPDRLTDTETAPSLPQMQTRPPTWRVSTTCRTEADAQAAMASLTALGLDSKLTKGDPPPAS